MHAKLLLDHCAEPDGTINAAIMAKALGIAEFELLGAAPCPDRLREVYCVISIIRPWTPTAAESWSWYNDNRLARFGGLTSAALVRAGRAQELKDYLLTGEALSTAWPPTLSPTPEAGETRLAASG